MQEHNYSFCLNQMRVMILWGQYEEYSRLNARLELRGEAPLNQSGMKMPRTLDAALDLNSTVFVELDS